MDPHCPRVGKLFGGCKFSPRYDRVPPSPSQMTAAATVLMFTSDIEALTATRYICDVCERCGKTLVRRKSEAPK